MDPAAGDLRGTRAPRLRADNIDPSIPTPQRHLTRWAEGCTLRARAPPSTFEPLSARADWP